MRTSVLTAVLLAGSCLIAIYSTSAQSRPRLAVGWGDDARVSSFTTVLDQTENASPNESISLLREFLQRPDINEREKREADYVLARKLQKTGISASLKSTPNGATVPDTGSEAVALYAEAAKIESLSEKSQWHICEIATAQGDEDRVRSALWTIHESSKSANTRASTEYGMAQSYIRTQQFDKASEFLVKIRKECSPQSEYAIGAAYYLGDLALRDSQNPEAGAEGVRLFEEYLTLSPGGHFSIEIINKLQQLASAQPGITMTGHEHQLFGNSYFANGRWKEALDQWELAKPNFKSVKKAVCLKQLGRAKEAMAQLIAVLKENPQAEYTYAADQICVPLSRDGAREFWQEIFNARPAKEDASLWNIGKRMSPPESLPLFKQLIDRYPTSEFAPEALWSLFWYAASQAGNDRAKLQSALTLAHEGVTRYPTTKTAAKLSFWSGKLYEQLKEPQQARNSYLFTIRNFGHDYYGQRARARVAVLASGDADKDRGWSTKPGREGYPLDWHWPTPQGLLSYTQMEEHYGPIATELCKLRQYDECLDALPEDVGPEFKSALYMKLNQPLQAIGTITRHVAGAPRETLRWQLAYPLLYAQDVAQDARTNGQDPLLVHALIREESRYNSRALSRSKALGLMQLMPATAYGVAKRLGVPLSGTDDILKPETNIQLGTNYLAYTIKRFNGNALLAVASYNGGPNAVQSWFKEHQSAGESDLDVFVENIKFRETRDYVRKVFGSYWNYQHIYGMSAKERADEEALDATSASESSVSMPAHSASKSSHAKAGAKHPSGNASSRHSTSGAPVTRYGHHLLPR